MTTLTLNLPEELSAKITREAHKNHISIQHYIVTALDSTISYSEAEEMVHEKLAHASNRNPFDILHAIPDRSPLPGDEKAFKDSTD